LTDVQLAFALFIAGLTFVSTSCAARVQEAVRVDGESDLVFEKRVLHLLDAS
jgi:hypothetical protein